MTCFTLLFHLFSLFRFFIFRMRYPAITTLLFISLFVVAQIDPITGCNPNLNSNNDIVQKSFNTNKTKSPSSSVKKHNKTPRAQEYYKKTKKWPTITTTRKKPRRFTTTATTPKPEKESLDPRFVKYSNYANSGFFVAIEETTSNSTKVFKMKKLPPIYSQTLGLSSNGGKFDDKDIEEIFEPRNQPSPESSSLSGLELSDAAIQKDWGGNCFAKDWRFCSQLKTILVMNVFNETKDGRNFQMQHMELDCKAENITCMVNGWSVNRCQIICMAKCNKVMFQSYDSFVSYVGACKYI